MNTQYLSRNVALIVSGLLFLPLSTTASPQSSLRLIAPIDSPEILTQNLVLDKNLYSLDRGTRRNVSLNLTPWANRSWKMNAGLIAARYADSSFSAEGSWRGRRSYIRENSVKEILSKPPGKQRNKAIDRLSAAEKYDLLVGDDSFTLTRANWSAGERYVRDGSIANWMGICEGTAAAGALYPEPQHAVDFTTPEGDLLRFHVMDIKGLAGLLWSSYNADIPISGSRCGTKNPRTDSNDVVLNESCFNSNPASFHIALLNFLGIHRKTFFINRVTAIEVWNVPILEYKIQYYRPDSSRKVSDLSDAILPLSRYKRDPFARYRSAQASSVVGVLTEIRIAKGTTTSRDGTDESSQATMSYRYDLELDSSGNILGGEWHQKSHPDFMWAVDDGFRPLSYGDKLIGPDVPWDGGRIPSSWLGPIRQASSRNQPLEKIVTKLIELSRQ